MSRSTLAGLLVAAVLGGLPAAAGAVPRSVAAEPSARPAAEAGEAAGETPSAEEAAADPAARILATLAPPVAAVAAEVLARNPDVARARAEAAAAAEMAPQARSLPDPSVGLGVFVDADGGGEVPETVVAALSQRFPAAGKRPLREREALARAEAARAEVAALRLELVTETRRLVWELAFLAAQERVVRTDRDTLVHYEERARARYASGVGLEQAVVKLQAEITQADARLLEIEGRRAALATALDALRDLPPETPPPAVELPAPPPPEELAPDLRLDVLGETARRLRPETARERARVTAAATAAELAAKEYRPDFTLGLEFTPRDRPEMPNARDSQGMVGLMVGVDLPVRRRRLAAGVAEAAQRRVAADEGARAVVAAIDQTLGELAARVPLARRQLALFDELLVVQAREALRSAEAAYAAGTLGALDLLDAERVLLDAEVAAARAHADYLILLARLEGAVGAPLADLAPGEVP